MSTRFCFASISHHFFTTACKILSFLVLEWILQVKTRFLNEPGFLKLLTSVLNIFFTRILPPTTVKRPKQKIYTEILKVD